MVVAVRRLKQLTRRVDSPYLKHVRPYVLWIPDFFGIWGYLHIHNKIPRVWDPILNMKLVCLNTYDANFIFVAFRLRPVMCSQAWNFPIRVCVRAQKVSGFGTFQILSFRIGGFQPTFLMLLFLVGGRQSEISLVGSVPISPKKQFWSCYENRLSRREVSRIPQTRSSVSSYVFMVSRRYRCIFFLFN